MTAEEMEELRFLLILSKMKENSEKLVDINKLKQNGNQTATL